MEKSSSGSRRQRQTKRVGERERRRVKESERETGTLRFTERKKQRKGEGAWNGGREITTKNGNKSRDYCEEENRKARERTERQETGESRR